ncbi:acetylajmalan esterase-like [Andrographis paniculata]|uniref:acetylajmalan esterase-like n=1 Tax=Andrographis paniculata TaxID=175694 RepID=UPI0021E72567|nr:acetylajmalan esterase-like [Andrographis paniculata]
MSNNSYYYNYNYIQSVFFLLFPLIILVSSKNPVCPFDYAFHFGDGVTDLGNSVLLLPQPITIPADLPPYGMTYPGSPSGRWSDGLVDFDFSAPFMGFPHPSPYLSLSPNHTSDGEAMMFSDAGSTVLDRDFFRSKGIKIPAYAVSFGDEFRWFKASLLLNARRMKVYLYFSICYECTDRATKKDWMLHIAIEGSGCVGGWGSVIALYTLGCIKGIVRNSLVMLGDIEANDLGYALSQGKSIEEAATYIPSILKTEIEMAKEIISMGAIRMVLIGSSPIGCFPYMLTSRATDDPNAYDNLGCLKDVNELIKLKNSILLENVENLKKEFPEVDLNYSPFGDGVLQLLQETSQGPYSDNLLKTCCGIGGKYNYDEKRFCGGKGVPVCSTPKEYVFWDGLHVTNHAAARIVEILLGEGAPTFNCTVPWDSSSSSASVAVAAI